MFEPYDGAGCAPGQEYKLTIRPIRSALANSFAPDFMFTSDVWIDKFTRTIHLYGKL